MADIKTQVSRGARGRHEASPHNQPSSPCRRRGRHHRRRARLPCQRARRGGGHHRRRRPSGAGPVLRRARRISRAWPTARSSAGARSTRRSSSSASPCRRRRGRSPTSHWTPRTTRSPTSRRSSCPRRLTPARVQPPDGLLPGRRGQHRLAVRAVLLAAHRQQHPHLPGAVAHRARADGRLRDGHPRLRGPRLGVPGRRAVRPRRARRAAGRAPVLPGGVTPTTPLGMWGCSAAVTPRPGPPNCSTATRPT